MGIGIGIPASKLHVSGGDIKLDGSNVFEFGAGLTKEANNGKIGYGTFEAGSLCVVGAGSAADASDRKITFWNSGGAKFMGNVRIEGDIVATGKVKIENVLAAKDICVNANASWCDYVFEDNYKLLSLSELELYIKKNKHLPEIPSQKQVLENGLQISEILQLQMKKIEELTSHVIDLEKKVKSMKK